MGGIPMNKIMLLLVAILIPLMMIASVFQIRQIKPEYRIHRALSNTRAWRLDEMRSFSSGLDNWEIDSRNTFGYSDVFPGRIDQVKLWYWDYENEEWFEFMTYDYTYDASGQYIIGTVGSYNMGGDPFPWLESTVEYDTQNRLTHMYLDMLDFEYGNWVPWQRFHINYVSNSNYTVYIWENQIIEPQRDGIYGKLNFQYDAQGRIIEEISSESADSLNWIASERRMRTYHANDTTTGDIIVQNIARWLPMVFMSDMFEPDFFGKISEEIEYYMEFPDWVNDYRMTYFYDDGMNLVHRLGEYWDWDAWASGDFSTYAYDVNGNLETRVDSYWDNWEMAWVDDWMEAYYWEFYTSINEDLAPPHDLISISAYPTPFVNEVHFTLQSKSPAPVKVEIFNQKGQLVRRFDAQPNTGITWDGKAANNRQTGSGIYFVKVSQEGMGSSLRRIVKLK